MRRGLVLNTQRYGPIMAFNSYTMAKNKLLNIVQYYL